MFSAAIKASSGIPPLPPAGNPPFQNVTMLLHGDGTNGAQNNTFLDSGPNNFSVSRSGNTTQGSFSPYDSNWSNYFSSTNGNYLTIANNVAFTLGQTFTVECWVFRTTNDNGTIVGRWYDASQSAWLMHIFGGGKLAFGTGAGSYSDVSATSIPLNTWTHLAVSNDTTSKRYYINGVLDATFSSDNISSLGSLNLTIAQNTGGGDGLPAYISNLRIVKGTALYSSNFTPSTTPLTAVTNTVLLTCQSNRFVDNSTNNFAITVTGTPSVQAFSPFAPSTAYSTSTNGGSGYFDGTGDNLSIAPSSQLTLSGDYTVEGWIYVPVAPTSYKRIWQNEPTGSGVFWFFYINGTNLHMFNVDAGVLTNVGSYRLNSWNHIAVSRQSSNTRIFVNGSETYSYSGTTTFTNNGWYVAGGPDTEFANCFISNHRVVIGTSVYNSNFTPPTSPVTAITNTKLLMNFTNGAIFDNAMMNNLETVGNAQISTSVVKYGTGSMAFDGTGDWLKIPSNQNFNFGIGNFTIEGWFNRTSGSNNGLFQLSTTVGGFVNGDIDNLAIGVSSNIFYYYANNSTNASSTVSISNGTWNHFALVRNGTTTTLYYNGVSIGSISDSKNYTATNLVVGGYYDPAYVWNGYIDDFRITKGIAVYTSNFIPPTAAFPNT